MFNSFQFGSGATSLTKFAVNDVEASGDFAINLEEFTKNTKTIFHLDDETFETIH